MASAKKEDFSPAARQRKSSIYRTDRTRAAAEVDVLQARLWALSLLHAVTNRWSNPDSVDGTYSDEDIDRAVGIIETLLREEARRATD